jgi:secreted protein with Ig-like and vWFA domain
MEEEIINKVANSSLEVFDLEDFYPNGVRAQIDLSQWLYEGFLLKEKDFREALKNHDWQQYEGQFIAINCSTDAILPAWASILVTTYVAPFAKKVVLGTISDLNTAIYQEILTTVDFSKYQDKPVILKGCSKKPVPDSAYIMAIQELQKVARSVMYGEACSAVPLYKKAK